MALATASQSPSAAYRQGETPMANKAATRTLMGLPPEGTATIVLLPCVLLSLTFKQRIDGESGDCREHNDGRFRDLLHLPEKDERHRHDGEGRDIRDRALAKHDDRARDRADRRGGAAVDERHDGRLLAMLAEIRRGDD